MSKLGLQALVIGLFTAISLFAAAETHVIVMHTNDILGHVLAGPNGGGSARLASVVRQVKPDLMLDSGGMLSGSLISDTFQGEPVVAAMYRSSLTFSGAGGFVEADACRFSRCCGHSGTISGRRARYYDFVFCPFSGHWVRIR